MIEVHIEQAGTSERNHQPYQVVLNINGVFFWMQVPASDKATAEQIAEQVRKDISTQVARYPRAAP